MKQNLFQVNRYFKDELIENSKLKAEEIGVLAQMENLMLWEQGPIFFDPKHIGKQCCLNRMKADRIIHSLIHKGCVYDTGNNKIFSEKIKKELLNVEERRKKASENGKKGAEIKAQNKGKQLVDTRKALEGELTNIKSENNTETGSMGGYHGACEEAEAFDIAKSLSEAELQEVRAHSCGYDLNFLAQKFNGLINSPKGELPIEPKKAFIAWIDWFTNQKNSQTYYNYKN